MEENEPEQVQDEKKPSHLLGYGFLALCIVLIASEIRKPRKSSYSSTGSYPNTSTGYSICDCERAYRAIMYGEGSHGENKYTGEKYTTLDASGNSYVDIIDKCASLYANGGKPLNDGGFSKYPQYQECIEQSNEPSNQSFPDTLIADWNPETYHIMRLDKIGDYLYNNPWNPKGFVLKFRGLEEDSYGNRNVVSSFQGHYHVSKRFQLEAKKYSSLDFYRWKTWTSTKAGSFGTLVKCIDDHNFNQSKICDCSFLMPD